MQQNASQVFEACFYGWQGFSRHRETEGTPGARTPFNFRASECPQRLHLAEQRELNNGDQPRLSQWSSCPTEPCLWPSRQQCLEWDLASPFGRRASPPVVCGSRQSRMSDCTKLSRNCPYFPWAVVVRKCASAATEAVDVQFQSLRRNRSVQDWFGALCMKVMCTGQGILRLSYGIVYTASEDPHASYTSCHTACESTRANHGPRSISMDEAPC